jgi:hypothetical protein
MCRLHFQRVLANPHRYGDWSPTCSEGEINACLTPWSCHSKDIDECGRMAASADEVGRSKGCWIVPSSFVIVNGTSQGYGTYAMNNTGAASQNRSVSQQKDEIATRMV